LNQCGKDKTRQGKYICLCQTNMILQEPEDGYSPLEKILLKQFIISIYSVIRDPVDKFILIARHESNYKQDEVAKMLGISQVAVSKRLTKMKRQMRAKRKRGEL